MSFTIDVDAPFTGATHPATDRDVVNGGQGNDLVVGNGQLDQLFGETGTDQFIGEESEVKDREANEPIGLPPLTERSNESLAQTVATVQSADRVLTFDNDFVSLPNTVLNGLTMGTIEFRLKTIQVATYIGLVSGATQTSADAFAISLDTQTNGVTLQIGSASVTWSNLGNFADGQFHHFAVTFDAAAGMTELFIDGVSQGTKAATLAAVAVDAGGLIIGQKQASLGGGFDSARAFTGTLDELRFWSAVQSQAAIKADLAKHLTGRETNLRAYFGFDESTGSRVIDATPNKYHGTLGAGSFEPARVSSRLTGTPLNGSPTDTITVFSDPLLAGAVAAALGIPVTTRFDGQPVVSRPILAGEMAELASLDLSNRGIRDLTGLEYAVNLRSLNLSGNALVTLSAGSGLGLAPLRKLEHLALDFNSLASFSGLNATTTLTALSVDGNTTLTDFSPLTTFTALQFLSTDLMDVSGMAPLLGHQLAQATGLVASDGTVLDAPAGALVLHAGAFGSLRVSGTAGLDAAGNPRTAIVDESFTVTQIGPPAADRTVTVEVSYTGSVTQTRYSGVTAIVFDGGTGNDTLDVSSDLQVPVIATGGVGNDTLSGGARADVLGGGAGTDTIDGRAGDNVFRVSDLQDTLSGTGRVDASQLAAGAGFSGGGAGGLVYDITKLTAVSGTDYADTFGVQAVGDSGLTFDGGAGGDTYTVQLTAATGELTIGDTGADSAADVLVIQPAGSAAVQLDVDAGTIRSTTPGETIHYTATATAAGLETLRFELGTAHDRLTIHEVSAATAVEAGGGNDRVTLGPAAWDNLLNVGAEASLAFNGAAGGENLLTDGLGDTLALAGDATLRAFDMTLLPIGRLRDVETLDLDGGAFALTITPQQVLNITGPNNTLMILSSVEDRIELGTGWTRSGRITVAGADYNRFTQTVGTETATVLLRSTDFTVSADTLAAGQSDDGAADEFDLRLDGENLVLRINGQTATSLPRDRITSWTINGSSDADRLTVAPAGITFPITFNAGAGSDSVTIVGAGDSGALAVAGNLLVTHAGGTITLDQTEQLGVDLSAGMNHSVAVDLPLTLGSLSVTGSAANGSALTVNLPSGVQTAAIDRDSIDVTDGFAAGSLHTIGFAGLASVTLNTGAGADETTVALDGLPMAVTINGGAAAEDQITVTAAVGSTLTLGGGAGAVTIADGTRTLTLTQTADLTLGNATGQTTVAGAVAVPGEFALTTARLDVVAGGSLAANGLALVADRMALGGPITAGSGDVLLRPLTADRPIVLGSTTDDADALELADAELDRIACGAIAIGADIDTTGPIDVVSSLSPAHAATLSLTTSGSMAQLASAPIQVASLNLTADSVTAVAQNDVDQLIAQTTGEFRFADADGFAISGTGLKANSVILQTGGPVTQLAGAPILATSLVLRGTGDVMLDQSNDVITLAAQLDGILALNDLNDLIAGTVDGTSGVNTNAHSVNLTTVTRLTVAAPIVATGADAALTASAGSIRDGQASGTDITAGQLTLAGVAGAGEKDNPLETAVLLVDASGLSGGLWLDNAGPLTLTRGIDTNGAGFTLNAPTLTVPSGSSVTTDGGDVTLTVDRLELDPAGAAVNAGTGTVSIWPRTDGRSVVLGSGAPDQLVLSDAVLDRVTAGMLVVGDTAAGPIVINETIDPAGADLLRLVTAGDVSQSAPLIVETIGVTAGGSVKLDHPQNNFGHHTVSISSTGAIVIREADGFRIGPAAGLDGLSGDAELIIIVENGDIVIDSLSALGPVTLIALNGSILPGADGGLIDAAELTLSATGDIGSGAGFQTIGLTSLNVSGGGNLLIQGDGETPLTELSIAVNPGAGQPTYGFDGFQGLTVGLTSDGTSLTVDVQAARPMDLQLTATSGDMQLGQVSTVGDRQLRVAASAGAVNLGSGALADGIGPILLGDGVFNLSAANSLGTGRPLQLSSGTLLKLNGFAQQVGSITGDGAVDLGGAVLTIDGDAVTTFGGTLAGNGEVRLQGGSLTLTGESPFTGSVAVTGGTLYVAGDQGSATGSGPVSVGSGGVLGGGGQIAGALHIAADGVLAPGTSPGRLTTSSVSFDSAARFQVELNGLVAGTEYDQLNVVGSVDLDADSQGGAVLELSSMLTAYPAGPEFVIVNNDGADAVQGTFQGLPEGAVLYLDGVPLTISYQGGDGNDVALKT